MPGRSNADKPVTRNIGAEPTGLEATSHSRDAGGGKMTRPGGHARPCRIDRHRRRNHDARRPAARVLSKPAATSGGIVTPPLPRRHRFMVHRQPGRGPATVPVGSPLRTGPDAAALRKGATTRHSTAESKKSNAAAADVAALECRQAFDSEHYDSNRRRTCKVSGTGFLEKCTGTRAHTLIRSPSCRAGVNRSLLAPSTAAASKS